MSERDETLVLAPFAFPARSRFDFSWAARQNESDGRVDNALLWRWRIHSAALRPDWTERFLAWIHARVPTNSLFDIAETLSWIRRTDPRHLVYRTPADVLPLARLAHVKGGRGLKQRARANEPWHWWMEEATPGAKPEDLEVSAGVLKDLVGAHLEALDEPLLGELSEDAWARHVPSPGRVDPDTTHDLAKLARMDNRTKRIARAGELARELFTPAPQAAVVRLHRAAILRQTASGLSLSPDTSARQLARALIRSWVLDGPAGRWGRLTLDPVRRELVDDALDQLEPDEFGKCVHRCAEAGTSTLGAIAAAESLIIAVGRRPDFTASTPKLVLAIHDLIAGLLPHLLETSRGLGLDSEPRMRRPLTRRGGDAELGLIAGCWRLSMAVPVPAAAADLPLALFPGWTRAPLSELAEVLRWWSAPTRPERPVALAETPTPPPSFDDLARVAVDVLKHVPNKPEAIVSTVPDVLLPAFVCSERPLPLGMIGHILDPSTPWRESATASAAQTRPEHVAARLWRTIDFQSESRSDLRLRLRYSRLAELMLAHLPEEEMTRSSAEVGADTVLACFGGWSQLPPRLRSLLLGRLTTAPDDVRTVFGLKPADLAPDDADALFALAAQPAAVGVCEQLLWQLCPLRALAATRDALTRARADDAATWFQLAPVEHTGALLAILKETCDAPPPELRSWLVARLGHAGHLAEDCWALLNRPAG